MQPSPTTLSCPICVYAIMRQLLPTRVVPPPPDVPREIVTHSRMTLSSPSTAPVGSPLYFRSCGATPTQVKEKNLFRAPTFNFPSSTTCETSSQFSPSSTSGPTVQ